MLLGPEYRSPPLKFNVSATAQLKRSSRRRRWQNIVVQCSAVQCRAGVDADERTQSPACRSFVRSFGLRTSASHGAIDRAGWLIGFVRLPACLPACLCLPVCLPACLQGRAEVVGVVGHVLWDTFDCVVSRAPHQVLRIDAGRLCRFEAGDGKPAAFLVFMAADTRRRRRRRRHGHGQRPTRAGTPQQRATATAATATAAAAAAAAASPLNIDELSGVNVEQFRQLKKMLAGLETAQRALAGGNGRNNGRAAADDDIDDDDHSGDDSE